MKSATHDRVIDNLKQRIAAVLSEYASHPLKHKDWGYRLKQAAVNESGRYHGDLRMLMKAIVLDEEGYKIYSENNFNPGREKLILALEHFEAALAITKHGHNATFNKPNVTRAISILDDTLDYHRAAILGFDDMPPDNCCYAKGKTNQASYKSGFDQSVRAVYGSKELGFSDDKDQFLQQLVIVLKRQIKTSYVKVNYDPVYKRFFNDELLQSIPLHELKDEVLQFSKTKPILAIYCMTQAILTRSIDSLSLSVLYISLGNIYRDNISTKTQNEFDNAQRFYIYALECAMNDLSGEQALMGVACHNIYSLYERPQSYGFHRELKDIEAANNFESLLERYIVTPIEEADRNFSEENFAKALKYYVLEEQRPSSDFHRLQSIFKQAVILQNHANKSRNNYDAAITCYYNYLKNLKDTTLILTEDERCKLESDRAFAYENLRGLYNSPSSFWFDESWADKNIFKQLSLSDDKSVLKARIIECFILLCAENTSRDLSSQVSELLTMAQTSTPDLSDLTTIGNLLLKKFPTIVKSDILDNPDELVSLVKICCRGVKFDIDTLKRYTSDLPLLNMLVVRGIPIDDEVTSIYHVDYLMTHPSQMKLAFNIMNPNREILPGKYWLNHFYPPKTTSDLSHIEELIKNGGIRINIKDEGLIDFVNSIRSDAHNTHDTHLMKSEEKYITALEAAYSSYVQPDPISFLKHNIQQYLPSYDQSDQRLCSNSIRVLERINEDDRITIGGRVFLRDIKKYLKLVCAVIDDTEHYSPDIKNYGEAILAFARMFSESIEKGQLVCTKGIRSHILDATNVIGTKINLDLSSDHELTRIHLDDSVLAQHVSDIVNKTDFSEDDKNAWRNPENGLIDSWPSQTCKIFGKVLWSLVTKKFSKFKVVDEYHISEFSNKSIDLFIANHESIENLVEAYITHIIGEEISDLTL